MRVLKSIYFVLLLIFLSLFLVKGLSVFAQTATPSATPTPEAEEESNVCSSVPECAEQGMDCSKCIEYLTQKKNDAAGQAKSLSSEISAMDNQIGLTEARIRAAEQQARELQGDIEIAEDKILGLESDIDRATRLLVERIAAVYQLGRVQPWEIFLTANDINDVFSRLKYLRLVQIYDKKKIYAAEQAKIDYNNQKEIFEDKESEAKVLGAKLEDYNKQLEGEKASKDSLLAVTQNSERQFQLLLDQARRELAALAGSQFTEKKEVKKGEVIGLMGSTGFSTGPHLHFGYYNLTEEEHNTTFAGNIGWYSTRNADPVEVLQNRSLVFAKLSCNDVQTEQTKNIGNGSFPWPLGTPYITQCYGNTPYSYVYSGDFHHGLDMATSGNISVTAAEDGVAYSYRGNTSFGNNVRVFHSNGKMSLYLHLQ